MKMYVAHSYEIDDPQEAVQDILQALPLDAIEGKNVSGIVTTHVDAVTSGVIDALAAALPFDFIGMTTFASCTDNEADIGLITIVMLVSENNIFASTLSASIHGDYKKALDEAYAEVTHNLNDDVSLCFLCAPFSRSISGQEITSHVSQLVGDTPIFGGLAADHTIDAQNTFVFRNGKRMNDGVAMLCVAGEVKVKFAFASLQPDAMQRKKAVITASDGNTVFTVNDMPVMNYIYSLGLSSEELQTAGAIIPFLVDYNDGSALVSREALGVTPEKHVFFGGEMPVGASIQIALQSPEEVISTAQQMLELIDAQKENLQAALVVGCAGRSMILGGDPLGEAREALCIIGDSLPYHQIYARGEICPVLLPNGKLQNRYHNFSFTVCMIENN